jgi:hypothetical protein
VLEHGGDMEGAARIHAKAVGQRGKSRGVGHGFLFQ